jgi:hypothetical protein
VGSDTLEWCMPLGKLNSREWDGQQVLKYLSTRDPQVKKYIEQVETAEEVVTEGE